MPFNPSLSLMLAKLCARTYDGDLADFSEFTDVGGKVVRDQFCVVGKLAGTQFVVIRGTSTLGGWIEDLDAVPVAVPGFAGLVHQGYAEGFAQLMPWLLGKITNRGQQIQITGHSLGGALATLISQRFEDWNYKVLPVYTFGSPRVGSGVFACGYTPEQVRITNGMDPVPCVPLGFDFEHVGTEYHLPGGGTPGWAHSAAVLARHLCSGFQQTFRDAVRDHFVDSYVAALETEAAHA